MKLEVNNREWLAIFGLLERQVPHSDKNLMELHNRMKASILSLMNDDQGSQFEKWFDITGEKVKAQREENKKIVSLAMQNLREEVLTADDEEIVSEYPKRVSKQQGGRGKPNKR
jgi:hypothetical protein